MTKSAAARYSAMVISLRLTICSTVALFSATPLSAEEFEATPTGSLIVKEESGGENIPNFRYDAKHTAGGLCQMTDETWRRVAPTIDIDLTKFPNAGSASRFMQNQACWKLLATDGVVPWTCCNKRLREHLSQQPALVRRVSKKPIEAAPETRAEASASHNWNVFAADEADSGGQSFLITGESH